MVIETFVTLERSPLATKILFLILLKSKTDLFLLFLAKKYFKKKKMSSETLVHFNIVSVNTLHHYPCRCHFCKKNREKNSNTRVWKLF